MSLSGHLYLVMSSLTTSPLPQNPATCRGVGPSLSLVLTSLPHSDASFSTSVNAEGLGTRD